jgi:hypothetical protein
MKKSIAMAWCEALESGEYEQGTGQLRDVGNNFCCLGVLCNLHAQAKPRLAAQQEEIVGYFGEDEFLPKRVMEWSGLKTNNGVFITVEDDPYYGKTNVANELTDMNDSGKTFSYIAKQIRTHWRKL